MIQIMPTFQPQPQDGAKAIEVLYEDIPVEAELEQKIYQNLFVIFLVDRSGSMSGKKMDITKQALQLFVKSLPSEDCFF